MSPVPVDPAMPANPNLSDIAAVDTGLLMADTAGMTPEQARRYREEEASVKLWAERINASRTFDAGAYQQMAIDRTYAAGQSAHAISVNLIGSNIDTMKSFLYAKDPDVSVVPAKQVTLPRLPRPVPPPDPMAEIAKVPQIAQLMAGGDPQAINAVMQDPAVQAIAAPLLAQHQAMTQRYQADVQAYTAEQERRRLERQERKAFAETLEILVSKTWQIGKLQPVAKKVVGAGLTTGCGFLKAVWREDRGLDPVSLQKLSSAQDNLARIQRTKEQLADGYGGELDAQEQALTELIAGLNAQTEMVTSRGLGFDHVASEDFTFPIGVTTVQDVVNAPWIDQRLFMTFDDALIACPELDKDKLKTATRWSQRQPVAPIAGTVTAGADPGAFSAENASQFVQGDNGTISADSKTMVCDGQGSFVCVHETWVRDTNMILTWIEGVKCYARPPHAPEIATSRFYPFFAFSPIEVDGQRYPQSLVYRSYKLNDDYNARVSALQSVRSRSKQGIFIDGSMVDKDNANNIKTSTHGEYTIVWTVGNKSLKDIAITKPIPRLEPSLYETETTSRDMEKIWGVQQALQGGVTVDKTATEAEIQQQGFGARTGYMRDDLERMLNELAQYTAQILIQRLTPEDAKAIAGQAAVWPTNVGAEDLDSLVTVSIRAGTSGKPNTTAERQAWATTMPLLQTSIMQIGQLRGADNFEIADKLEQLAAITLQLSGSSLDIESLIPQEGMPQPGDMAAPPGVAAGPGADPANPNGAPTPGAPPMPEMPAPQTVQ